MSSLLVVVKSHMFPHVQFVHLNRERGTSWREERQQQNGEVAACSLARERRRRQSLALGPLRDREKH